jgi:hypothetical protein
MVFTIAEELRKYFMRNRKLLAILPLCAAEVIKSWNGRSPIFYSSVSPLSG